VNYEANPPPLYHNDIFVCKTWFENVIVIEGVGIKFSWLNPSKASVLVHYRSPTASRVLG